MEVMSMFEFLYNKPIGKYFQGKYILADEGKGQKIYKAYGYTSYRQDT